VYNPSEPGKQSLKQLYSMCTMCVYYCVGATTSHWHARVNADTDNMTAWNQCQSKHSRLLFALFLCSTIFHTHIHHTCTLCSIPVYHMYFCS